MGISLEHSIYVGDTPSDIKFAKNAGVTPVAVESGMGSVIHMSRENPALITAPDLPTLAAAMRE